MGELYLCKHMGWEFTSMVFYSRKVGVWLLITPSDVFYLSSREGVDSILKSFDECKLIEKGRIHKSAIKTIAVGLK